MRQYDNCLRIGVPSWLLDWGPDYSGGTGLAPAQNDETQIFAPELQNRAPGSLS
jgi:hypothetical protein